MLKQEYERWVEASSGWMKEDLKILEGLSPEEFRIELTERFSVDAEFGTGGLRSKIRAGTNGINDFWIKRICKAVRKNSKKIVIAYDTRRCSKEFAQIAANTLSAGYCQVYLFQEPVPTPILSFTVKQIKCDTGIVITASHNPKEYNGFKLYDSNGVQYVPQKIESLNELMKDIPLIEKENEKAKSHLIEQVGEEVYEAYFSMVFDELSVLSPKETHGHQISVVYTPLHGTGASFVPKIMRKYGIDVQTVEKQMKPDPDFSTVKVPNPEDQSSFKLAMKKAEQLKVRPQALIATDPDSDRLGLFIQSNGKYHSLTGNELGILLLDFILEKSGISDYKGNTAVLKTIVTTEGVKPIAEKYNLLLYETLTGFKYLGEKSVELRSRGIDTLFSFEESFGYLFGTHAGDKDACSTSGLLALLLLESKSGEGIIKRLESIRSMYGCYLEQLLTRTAEGVSGMKKLHEFMHFLRKERSFMSWEEGITLKDYQEETGELHADVVEYRFQNGDRVIFRPSGTEPRIKAYINVHAYDKDSAYSRVIWMRKRVESLFDSNLK